MSIDIYISNTFGAGGAVLYLYQSLSNKMCGEDSEENVLRGNAFQDLYGVETVLENPRNSQRGEFMSRD